MTKQLLSNNILGILATIFFSLVVGCTAFQHLPEHTLGNDETVALKVPFVPQAQDNDCGPAALASVLKFYGTDMPLEELTEKVYIPELNRTMLPDMENFARALGFATASGSGNTALLMEQIDSGKPVIILMEAGFGIIKRPHYIVIWGHTPSGFLTHAGIQENVFIDYDQLDRRWQQMNRLYLVIN